jgi:diguanylate cyclase (GGDEF)-like protein
VSREAKTVNLLSKFENKSKSFYIIAGFALIAITGIADFLTGYELAFSLFYVIPVSFVTWHIGRRFGLVTSFASAVVWFSADIGHPYSSLLIPIWNTYIRLVFFVLITWLLSALKSAIEHQRELAHIDYLTGAVNSRFFYELVQMEIDRLRRYEHPFTIAYIDIDNFKIVNDQFGHTIGDQVLCTVVSSAKNHLRKTDVVARLGGDELVLLLPETNQESARIVLSRTQAALLEEMQQSNYPITFSMGVITCNSAPPTTNELVSMADDLMYSVKRDGKNAIKYAAYGG